MFGAQKIQPRYFLSLYFLIKHQTIQLGSFYAMDLVLKRVQRRVYLLPRTMDHMPPNASRNWKTCSKQSKNV